MRSNTRGEQEHATHTSILLDDVHSRYGTMSLGDPSLHTHSCTHIHSCTHTHTQQNTTQHDALCQVAQAIAKQVSPSRTSCCGRSAATGSFLCPVHVHPVMCMRKSNLYFSCLSVRFPVRMRVPWSLLYVQIFVNLVVDTFIHSLHYPLILIIFCSFHAHSLSRKNRARVRSPRRPRWPLL